MFQSFGYFPQIHIHFRHQAACTPGGPLLDVLRVGVVHAAVAVHRHVVMRPGRVWHGVTVVTVVTGRVTQPGLWVSTNKGREGLARALEVAQVSLGDAFWATRAVDNWPEREGTLLEAFVIMSSHISNMSKLDQAIELSS